jgi:hypothetical protein
MSRLRDGSTIRALANRIGRRSEGQFHFVETPEVEIFRQRRHVGTVHTLALEAEHHHDVGAVEALAHVAGHFDAEALDAGRKQRGGGNDPHTRAHLVEQDDIGARDPRMQDIAADRHQQAFDAALVAADGERIEQSLRRVLVCAVAGIDHGAVELAGEQFDRAGSMMAHNQDIGVHGVERDRGVDQRLALAHGGLADRHVHDVGAKPFSRQLERRLGAGGGFEKQVDLGAAAQRGLLLFDLAIEFYEFFAEVEQTGNFRVRKAFDPQQMPMAEDERGFRRNGH